MLTTTTLRSRENPALFAVSLAHRHDELACERRQLLVVVDVDHVAGHKLDAAVWLNEKRGLHLGVLT